MREVFRYAPACGPVISTIGNAVSRLRSMLSLPMLPPGPGFDRDGVPALGEREADETEGCFPRPRRPAVHRDRRGRVVQGAGKRDARGIDVLIVLMGRES